MKFLIADTFTDSLARLTHAEQKATKLAAFDLQLDPAGEGKKFHRLVGIKDKNFWSTRVNDDLRIIVHMTNDSFLLCYVAHHDPAYDWARRRKLETHPRTGAAQLVEVRETVQAVILPRYVEVEPAAPAPKLPFAAFSDEVLKGLEFRAVVVMACNDEVVPLLERLEAVGDQADLQEVYDSERYLLYVACTRARDHLLVTSLEPVSEFLADLKG